MKAIIQKLWMLMAMLWVFIPASAFDFEAGGICYNILSDTEETVAVTSGDVKYSGDVVIPETVTYNGKTYTVRLIGNYAFAECSGLTSVTIPNSVTSIGELAFGACNGLTSVTVPNSVTSIGDGAFASCSKLEAVYVESGNTAFCSQDGILYDINMTALICCPGKKDTVSIPSTVSTIGAGAFYGCVGLTSMTIPNSVTTVGDSAFHDCTGLTSVSIPNSVVSIGEAAFFGCIGLASVTIPNSVTSIGVQAFSYCTDLEAIYVDPGNTAFCSQDGILYDADMTTLICCPSKNTTITIPNTVTSIGFAALYGCSGLTSETIPNSVTSIGDFAFWDCSCMTSVNISNSVTSIGDYAFAECSGLTSVDIPNSVTSIGEGAFAYCSGLPSVNIPNSVTSIANYTFIYCSGLTSVTIPNSVISIDVWAFAFCSGLTSVTIPNSVTSIGKEAFWGCTGLTSVTIPNSVRSIGMGAFYSCNSLETIYNQMVEPLACEPGFSDDNYTSAKLYVPTGSLEAYRSADPWRYFQNIEEMDFAGVDGVEAGMNAKTEVGRFNLQGVAVGKDYKGLIVVKYSDGTCGKVYSK